MALWIQNNALQRLLWLQLLNKECMDVVLRVNLEAGQIGCNHICITITNAS